MLVNCGHAMHVMHAMHGQHQTRHHGHLGMPMCSWCTCTLANHQTCSATAVKRCWHLLCCCIYSSTLHGVVHERFPGACGIVVRHGAVRVARTRACVCVCGLWVGRLQGVLAGCPFMNAVFKELVRDSHMALDTCDTTPAMRYTCYTTRACYTSDVQTVCHAGRSHSPCAWQPATCLSWCECLAWCTQPHPALKRTT